LDLFVGGVFVRVRDLGGFSEAAYARTVPGADEEGGDGGSDDVARWRVRRGCEAARKL